MHGEGKATTTALAKGAHTNVIHLLQVVERMQSNMMTAREVSHTPLPLFRIRATRYSTCRSGDSKESRPSAALGSTHVKHELSTSLRQPIATRPFSPRAYTTQLQRGACDLPYHPRRCTRHQQPPRERVGVHEKQERGWSIAVSSGRRDRSIQAMRESR